MCNLSDHPGCVLPVIILNPETYEVEGKFAASLVSVEAVKYLQVDTATYSVNKLLTERGAEWGFMTFIGGVFRISVDSPILGPLG